MKKSWIALSVSVLVIGTTASFVKAQQVTGTPGSPSATTTIDGKQLSAARSEIRRRDQGRRPAVEALVGAAHRAAEGRAERAADHHRRRRLRRAQHLRRRHPDADDGPHRQRGPALQPTCHSTALCSPTRAALITGRNHHSAGFGVISEQSTGFPGYNSIIDKDKATIGRILLGQRLRHLVVRQGPQHAGLRGQPGRAVRPVADRHGLRVFLRLRRRRRQPVAAEPVPQHDPDLSVRGQAAAGTWSPAMADDAIDYMNRMHQIQPDKPIFIKYAPGATHAPHHPTKEWVDKISKHEAVRRGLEQGARDASSRTRSGSA